MNSAPGTMPSILLVEDDRISAAFLSAALATLPARVHVAEDCAQALAASGPFDAWLIDANLPDGSGTWLLQRLRATDAAACALAHTADTGLATRAHGRIGQQVLGGIHRPLAEHQLRWRVIAVAHRGADGLGLQDLVGQRIDPRDEARRVFRQGDLQPFEGCDQGFGVSGAGLLAGGWVRRFGRISDSFARGDGKMGAQAPIALKGPLPLPLRGVSASTTLPFEGLPYHAGAMVLRSSWRKSPGQKA